MTAETPPERFARRQAERDAAKAVEREAIGRKIVEDRARPKVDVMAPPPVRRKTRTHGVEYALTTADLVQRHGITETAKLLGESRQTVYQRLQYYKLDACHPILHAEDYATRHGLATWERES